MEILVSDLAQLKPEHFDDLLDSALPIADSSYALTLKSVERLASPSPRGVPFVLTFAGPAGTRGQQGIYRLQHPRHGEMAIFLVPIASPDELPRFEAVFN